MRAFQPIRATRAVGAVVRRGETTDRIWLFGFQRGLMVASRSQLGLPA
jgi:hypothetical protein